VAALLCDVVVMWGLSLIPHEWLWCREGMHPAGFRLEQTFKRLCAWTLDEETATLGGSFAVYSEKSFAGCPLSSHAALVSTQPGKDWWTTHSCAV